MPWAEGRDKVEKQSSLGKKVKAELEGGLPEAPGTLGYKGAGAPVPGQRALQGALNQPQPP